MRRGTPKIGSPSTKASESDYEESFESFSSPTSKSPSKSPSKPLKGDGKDGESSVAGMDLETFMGNYKINIGNDGEEEAPNKDDPSMRPLDGVSPSREVHHRALHKKFGALSDSASDASLQTLKAGGELDPSKRIISSPVDVDTESHGDKENHDNNGRNKIMGNVQHNMIAALSRVALEHSSNGEGGDDEAEAIYKTEAESLLAKIRGGSLGNGILNKKVPNSIEKKLKNVDFSAPAFQGGGMGAEQGLMGVNESVLDSMTRDTPERESNHTIKKPLERGPIDEERMSYYSSLVGDRADSKKSTQSKKTNSSKSQKNRATMSTEDHNDRVNNLLAELLPTSHLQKHAKAASKVSARLAQSKKAKEVKEGGGTVNAQNIGIGSERLRVQPPEGMVGRKEFGIGAGPAQSVEHHTHANALTGDRESLTSQIAQLKKDMKGRDDRLQRLTEHSMQLGTMCDNQKNEIGELKARVRQYELELDAKEQRATDSQRLSKKAKKKAARLESELKEVAGAAKEVERLQDREAALLEAVDALSAQNEDLIRKLKQSMARELELSQRHVSMAHSSLSGINESLNGSPSSPPRAQSDTRLTRGKKKSKRDGEEKLPNLQKKYFGY